MSDQRLCGMEILRVSRRRRRENDGGVGDDAGEDIEEGPGCWSHVTAVEKIGLYSSRTTRRGNFVICRDAKNLLVLGTIRQRTKLIQTDDHDAPSSSSHNTTRRAAPTDLNEFATSPVKINTRIRRKKSTSHQVQYQARLNKFPANVRSAKEKHWRKSDLPYIMQYSRPPGEPIRHSESAFGFFMPANSSPQNYAGASHWFGCPRMVRKVVYCWRLQFSRAR